MSFPTKDYQQSTTEGKNKILARLQQSGMQDLTWYTHMEQVTTSIDESVDKKPARRLVAETCFPLCWHLCGRTPGWPCSSTCGGVCCLDGSCSAWCGQTQPHSLGGGPPRSGPSACLRAVRAPNQRNPKSGASAESKHVETQQLKPQEAPPF